ncbi:MFS transporter [Sphingomonas sp.]|jgi:MFS family permease|uniref:MFS transporter n=1 Tax=Sphingomonas sp. TaxID=28214 RepID=UPI002EDB76F0
MARASSPASKFLLVVSGTVIGIAGTDLVLPAIPGLPRVLGGTLAEAQLVLAAFTAGAAIGLLGFGELGARFDRRKLLVGSLLAYGLISTLCGFASSLPMLIALRVVQGAAGAAAAVYAPGIVRSLYGDERAVAKLGLLGSVESMAPALAPIAGVWLLAWFGWRASFDLIAVAALLLAALVARWMGPLPPAASRRGEHGYHRLLVNYRFQRQALGHAFTLGGLLVFVFGAPTVFTHGLGGTLTNFIAMQLCGIASFIFASSLTGRLTADHGAERVILWGTLLSAAGGLGMLGYALAGGGDTRVVTAIFLALNAGLGFRGAPGFHAAVVEARGDDARGAALVVVAILGTTSLGTAAVAPFIEGGLVPLAIATAAITTAAALLCLMRPAQIAGAAPRFGAEDAAETERNA